MSGGPGQSHREGMTLAELFKRFPDDAAAERYFVQTRWPEGPHCPYCGSTNVLHPAKHKTMPYRCREKDCRKRFSVRTRSVMEGSNLGYQTWAVAIYLLMTSLKSVSSMKLHRDLGITQKSAWFLAHRLREAWRIDDGPFGGPVEVDEVYMGGKFRNMHAHKRREAREKPHLGKTVVAGAKDRESNRVSATVVKSADPWTLRKFIENRVISDAQIYSDDHASYGGLIFHDHESVRHSHGEYVRGKVHNNRMESFWSMLKRAHTGTFHKISPKHMDCYVTEFTGRHNDRHSNTEQQMRNLVEGMSGRRLRYPDLIADNGLASGARPRSHSN